MARKIITQDMVFNAAREIVAQGEQPTLLTVHKRLGRGSFSTVKKYLKIWEESSEAAEARIDSLPKETEVPDTLSSDTESLIKKLWTAAKTIADEQLTVERNALEVAKAQYQAEVEQAIDMADQATEKHDELSEHLEETIESNARDIEQLKAIIAEEKQNSAVKAQEIARLQGAISDQNVTREQLQAELKEQSEALAVKNAESEQLAQRNQEQAASLTAIKEAAEDERNKANTLQTTLELKIQEVNHLNEQIKQQVQSINQLRKELEVSTAQTKDELTTLRVERENAINEATTERTKVESLTAQLNKQEKQQIELQKQLLSLAKDNTKK